MSESKTKTPLGDKIKHFLYFAVAILVIIVIFQNTQEVDTTFLLVSFAMPRWLALLGTLAIGFFLGAFFGRRWLPGFKKK